MRVVVWASLLCLVSPAAWADAPTSWAEALAREGKKKRKLKEKFSDAERRQMLRAGSIWYPVATEQVDLAGTPDFFPAKYDPHVPLRCDYLDEETGGTTPKFKCRVVGGPNAGTKIKVKYLVEGARNDEVHTEIAATRIFWALGFGADFIYPIDRLICRGCPKDPHHGGEIVPWQIFEHVMIEEKLGKKIEAEPDQGWQWAELEAMGAKDLPAATRRAQLDALKLLAVMLRHYDNKPENQRLICLKADIGKDGLCKRPHFLVQDLGGTFGPGWNGYGPAFAKWWRQKSYGRWLSDKFNLDGWIKAPIWHDRARCVGDLNHLAGAAGGLEMPRISEAGRAFLAERLQRLRQNPQGLVALFRAARFPRPRAWAAAFWAKADAIINHTCPE